VNGRTMTRERVCEFVEQARPHVLERGADGVSPTFFETVTAMACWEFARQDVDVAVLEVGIGGKQDATSVVDPVASAVTSVTLEHTAILGDTVEEIARDKAHVAPADAPLVTAADGAALDAIREVAGDICRVGRADAVDDPEALDLVATYEGRVNHTEAAVTLAGADWRVETRVPTVGAHHAVNAGVAVALARQVGDPTDAEVARGVRNAHWPGRFEVMETDPLVVIDGAHNPGACEALADSLAEFDHASLHLVVGVMHDKDVRGMAAALPAAETVVASDPAIDRAEDPEVLGRVFEEAGAETVVQRESVEAAVDAARDAASPADMVLVTGSLFTVAEARREWTRLTVPKRLRDESQARAAFADAGVDAATAAERAPDGVHRTVATRVSHAQARRLREESLAVGADCVVSTVDSTGEQVDAVVLGTHSQFAALTDRLDDLPGFGGLADQLRDVLDGQDDADEPTSSDKPGDAYPWSDGASVMGILNVTPDSFHDGGEYDAVDDAVARAEAMVDAGADVVDVGGESTRPGADPVPVDEEIDRVVPVVERLDALDATVSVDTRKAAVAEAALEAGADLLNDVSGLEDPEMRFLAAEYDVPLVVMHSVEVPVDPDTTAEYDDVVDDVIRELRERVLLAERAGLDRNQILVDPGLGFGKTASESFELLDRLDEFRALGCPILVGHSHKSMFGGVGSDAGERLPPTVAATALAVDRGADVVRVHDVAENVAALRTAAGARDPDRVDE
jgi:dihydropteroate synthase